MFPPEEVIDEARRIRQELHARPELSGEETASAAAITSHLAQLSPESVVEALGGTGVAAVFAGKHAGPTVMVRCELDALPIEELSQLPYRSEIPGKAHLCGHDGHMAILLALGKMLKQAPPPAGRVVLLFQPAEETGKGARAVLADPRFYDLGIDYALSLHNLPGFPLHRVLLKPGHVNCASRGMRIRFEGKTAHASMPETGLSPAAAMTSTVEALTGLSRPGPLDEAFALVTVVHATLGEPAFGVSPGHAEVWATLRTVTDEQMSQLVASAEALAQNAAEADGLTYKTTPILDKEIGERDSRTTRDVIQGRIVASSITRVIPLMSFCNTAIFCCLDDFAQTFEDWEHHNLIPTGRKRRRSGKLCLGEMLFIMVLFHLSPFKDFKHFWHYGVEQKYRKRSVKA